MDGLMISAVTNVGSVFISAKSFVQEEPNNRTAPNRAPVIIFEFFFMIIVLKTFVD